jgi:hypothetical protein
MSAKMTAFPKADIPALSLVARLAKKEATAIGGLIASTSMLSEADSRPSIQNPLFN